MWEIGKYLTSSWCTWCHHTTLVNIAPGSGTVYALGALGLEAAANPSSTEKPLSVLTPPAARPRAWVAYSHTLPPSKISCRFVCENLLFLGFYPVESCEMPALIRSHQCPLAPSDKFENFQGQLSQSWTSF